MILPTAYYNGKLGKQVYKNSDEILDINAAIKYARKLVIFGQTKSQQPNYNILTSNPSTNLNPKVYYSIMQALEQSNTEETLRSLISTYTNDITTLVFIVRRLHPNLTSIIERIEILL